MPTTLLHSWADLVGMVPDLVPDDRRDLVWAWLFAEEERWPGMRFVRLSALGTRSAPPQVLLFLAAVKERDKP